MTRCSSAISRGTRSSLDGKAARRVKVENTPVSAAGNALAIAVLLEEPEPVGRSANGLPREGAFRERVVKSRKPLFTLSPGRARARQCARTRRSYRGDRSTGAQRRTRITLTGVEQVANVHPSPEALKVLTELLERLPLVPDPVLMRLC
jgi:hypothetical protein